VKYLSRFNESFDFSNIIEECEYILLDLTDDKSGVGVEIRSSGDRFYISIFNNYDVIKLREHSNSFKRLLKFLKLNEFKLMSNSYVTNDSWDPIHVCPVCYSDNIESIDDEEGKCLSCKSVSDIIEFVSFRHYMTESEFNYFIDNNYWVEDIQLNFKVEN